MTWSPPRLLDRRSPDWRAGYDAGYRSGRVAGIAITIAIAVALGWAFLLGLLVPR